MASATSSLSKKIALKSSDGQIFKVDEKIALQSKTIENLMVDLSESNDPILLANVTGKILSKVIEYCDKHVADNSNSVISTFNSGNFNNDLKEWDTNFLNVDQNTLFDIILAANYMDIKSLLDLTCQCVADMIKEKSPEEVREIFHIVNDYTAEEEARVRSENAWAFKNN